MLALKFYGENNYRIEEVETPNTVQNSVLLKIVYAPICGTDTAIIKNKISAKYEVILGHEYYGIVKDIGEGVKEFRINDKVIGSPSIPCLNCFYCKRGYTQLCNRLKMFGLEIDGSFSEYMLIPSANKVLTKTHIDGKVASLLGDTITTGYHAVERTKLIENETLVILGAGPIGCATLITALKKNPNRVYVIARSNYRLNIAEKLGGTILNADELDVQRYISEDALVGVDAVIDCAGSQTTLNLAMKLVKKGGRIIIASIMPEVQLSMLDIMVREKHILGAFCPLGPKCLNNIQKFVEKNNLQSDLRLLITHEFDLKNGLEAIEVFDSRERMKILINP